MSMTAVIGRADFLHNSRPRALAFLVTAIILNFVLLSDMPSVTSAYSSRQQYPSVTSASVSTSNGRGTPTGRNTPNGRSTPLQRKLSSRGGRSRPSTAGTATEGLGVSVQDFQDNNDRNGRPTVKEDRDRLTVPRDSSASDGDGAANIPDLRQREIHIPTRTSSNRNSRRKSSNNPANHTPSTNEISSASDSTPASNSKSSGRDSTITESSLDSFDTTRRASILPPLQIRGPPDETDHLSPVNEDDPGSWDLLAPSQANPKTYSLEARSDILFSKEHLSEIFKEPSLLLKFTTFLSNYRPNSIPILIYYLDATKALKAISYANAVAEALEPIEGQDFTTFLAKPTVNSALEDKASLAFDALVREDLPAFITHTYIQVVSLSITRRITGNLAPHLREASEGLAEVFCLTDPSRPDNPIVFASEEFHRTTQYGMSYALGRNCRFLQGPRTNPFSVRRLRAAVEAGKEQCEVFLNYRRDGSPFMNLVMTAPLMDSRGKIRYFIGAQVDVSGMVKECTQLEAFKKLVAKHEGSQDKHITNGETNGYTNGTTNHDGFDERKDEFEELAEMFNMGELETVRRYGGRMHREQNEDDDKDSARWQRPRLLLRESDPPPTTPSPTDGMRGKLSGIYKHYLLVRPYPSLRILFTSPSLRVPGILQSPFMNKIGGSTRVREELTAALAEGRGVTAKVRWLSRPNDEEGRNRWIHCTPLVGTNGHIGVWMIVVVDDDKDTARGRRWKQAPPVNINIPSNKLHPHQATNGTGGIESSYATPDTGILHVDEGNYFPTETPQRQRHLNAVKSYRSGHVSGTTTPTNLDGRPPSSNNTSSPHTVDLHVFP